MIIIHRNSDDSIDSVQVERQWMLDNLKDLYAPKLSILLALAMAVGVDGIAEYSELELSDTCDSPLPSIKYALQHLCKKGYLERVDDTHVKILNLFNDWGLE